MLGPTVPVGESESLPQEYPLVSDRIPVLFDTDIGSDIDDAVALAYLLAEPRCELVGITMVSGEPVERARLASALCRAAGRNNVPIRAGWDHPLAVDPLQPACPQKEILGRWAHRHDFDTGGTVTFMRDAIRARPGEITLLAVGPLTNLAVLFALDPELPSLLKELVLMGGVFTSKNAGAPRAEWNIVNDPHAAARVFKSRAPKITAYGLDVTLRCRLDAEECRRRFKGGALAVVADMAEVWFRKAGQITFHDPLAAVSLFHPTTCTLAAGRVEVELAPGRPAGMTYFTADPAGRHHVALEVDVPKFFERYFGVF